MMFYFFKYHTRKTMNERTDKVHDYTLVENMDISVLNLKLISMYKKCLLNKELGEIDDTEKFLRTVNAAGIGSKGQTVPTVAGLLMFGDAASIRKVYPNYFLDYRELSHGKEIDWDYRMTSDTEMVAGSIFEFFMKSYMKLLQYGKIKELNLHAAIKEAAANAFIHADYSGRQGIVIKASREVIEISNPGTMLISEPQFFKGGISDPRNPLVFHLFTQIGMGDHAGSGAAKILDVWERQEWSKPICHHLHTPERVELLLNMR